MSIRHVLITAVSTAALLLGLAPATAATAGAAPAAEPRWVAPAASQCTNSDLRASFRPSGVAAGSAYGRLRLRNVSDSPCTVRGYGGVSYVGGGDGTQIGHAAVRERRRTARTWVVRPGRSVVSTLRMANADNYPKRRCRPAPVDGFRIYVPDARVSQYVPHRTRGCRNGRVHLLHQRPYHRPSRG
jgi:hypothetical protein